MAPEASGTGGGRLAAILDWLRGSADNPVGRLAILWFRRYLEASRNSGAAASAYFMLSAVPAALVVVAFFNLAAGNQNAFAARLTTHLKLDGSVANLVHGLFGTTSNNVLAASVTVIIGFLFWGLAIGQLYQDLYARVWRIHVGSAADQALFAIWFFVASALVGLMMAFAADLRSDGWLALIPASSTRLDDLLAVDTTLPAASQDHNSLAPARRATRVLGPRRYDRHVATVDRAYGEPGRQSLQLVRRRHRDVRVHPHLRHHLDGLCGLLTRLGRVATSRTRPKRTRSD